MIGAKTWREMPTPEVLRSIEVALSVLADRGLTHHEALYLLHILKAVAELLEKELA